MMNGASIAQALSDVVAHLSDGNLEQAKATLDVLEFERLLNPKRSRSKGPQMSVDPAQSFGIEGVQQTGDHISRCREAIRRGNGQSALDEAKAALARWNDVS